VAIRQDVFGKGKKKSPKITPKNKDQKPPEQNEQKLERKSGTPSKITFISGPKVGVIVPLTRQDIILGRSDNATIVLDDKFVSSKHARIFPQNDMWYMEDLDATNGTYIDGERLIGIREVYIDTEVKIGSTIIKFIS
jgi:pSer/pThr/pTyr-binding forkhead associated (FHA) protein